MKRGGHIWIFEENEARRRRWGPEEVCKRAVRGLPLIDRTPKYYPPAAIRLGAGPPGIPAYSIPKNPEHFTWYRSKSGYSGRCTLLWTHGVQLGNLCVWHY